MDSFSPKIFRLVSQITEEGPTLAGSVVAVNVFEFIRHCAEHKCSYSLM
jgi:hypothetical protein